MEFYSSSEGRESDIIDELKRVFFDGLKLDPSGPGVWIL